jgi:hypothetical protein
MSAAPLLSVERLSMRFGGLLAIDDLSLTFDKLPPASPSNRAMQVLLIIFSMTSVRFVRNSCFYTITNFLYAL